jgi:hypothetical protein
VTVRLVHPKPLAEQTWRAPIGAGGTFRVGPLPRGTFEVEVAATGLVQTGHVVADGDGDPVELTCEQGGVVAGRLLGPSGPLAHAPKILLLQRDDKGRFQPFDGTCRSEADPLNLRFRVDGLGPGEYVVRVVAEGFAPARSAPFTLQPGVPVENLTVALGDGCEASGRLVDARGAPLARARVTAFEGFAPPPPALQELFPSDARQTAFTADDGRFAMTMLSPGAQTFVIEMPGQPPRTIGPIWIAEKGEAKFGDLTLGGGAILSATLHGAKGAPAPFGTARLARKDGAVDLVLVADEQGNCCLRGLPAGTFTFSAEGGGATPEEFALRSGDTKRVELAVAGH